MGMHWENLPLLCNEVAWWHGPASVVRVPCIFKECELTKACSVSMYLDMQQLTGITHPVQQGDMLNAQALTGGGKRRLVRTGASLWYLPSGSVGSSAAVACAARRYTT